MQKLEDPSIQDPSSLQDKMKLLQKHQVFEAEILANEEIITAVNKVTHSASVFTDYCWLSKEGQTQEIKKKHGLFNTSVSIILLV